MIGRKLSVEEVNNIRQLRNCDNSLLEIAIATGFNKSTISFYCRGIPMTRSPKNTQPFATAKGILF